MSIFHHFQEINLTNDQHKALEMLNAFLESDERVFVLQGYAGSGKTTLVKGFVEYLNSIEKKYQLMAPTGRAAKVINQKTGYGATTIHKGIYSYENLEEIKNSDDENDITFLYQFVLRNSSDTHNSVLIVDEASMVSDILSQGEFFRFGSGRLLTDLITYSKVTDSSTTSKLIFIGDPAQLPPIGMNFSPALDINYFKEKFKLKATISVLKEVKRQSADNGILTSATKIRKCLTAGYFNDFDLRANNKDIFNPNYHDYLNAYKRVVGKKIIICYKNKTAQDLNKEIRSDKFGSDLPIQASDIVIISGNNYKLGIMNGEFGLVSEASPCSINREIRFRLKDGKTKTINLKWRSVSLILPDENNIPKSVNGYILENYLYGDNNLTSDEQRALYVDFKMRHPKLKKGSDEFKEAIINDAFFNCIMLKYGYAVTCHKAQGGEWQNAFVFWDRGAQTNFNFYETPHTSKGKTNSDFYRWAYTALTRASKSLFCVNPPYFNSFSRMNFIDVNVQQAFNDLIGKSNEAVELNYEDIKYELEKFGLPEAPLTIQDHFIERFHLLKAQYIDVVEWQRVGYEIRYVLKREKETAAFMYWVNGKNEFKTNFQKIPKQTTSNKLFDEVCGILDTKTEVLINRTSPGEIIKKIEFDWAIEEEKPFLKELFEQIEFSLSDSEVISNIEHLSYRERYTISSKNGECVFDFEYDGDGFFGRVLPIEKKCHNHELLVKIKSIIQKLKTSDYVV